MAERKTIGDNTEKSKILLFCGKKKKCRGDNHLRVTCVRKDKFKTQMVNEITGF